MKPDDSVDMVVNSVGLRFHYVISLIIKHALYGLFVLLGIELAIFVLVGSPVQRLPLGIIVGTLVATFLFWTAYGILCLHVTLLARNVNRTADELGIPKTNIRSRSLIYGAFLIGSGIAGITSSLVVLFSL